MDLATRLFKKKYRMTNKERKEFSKRFGPWYLAFIPSEKRLEIIPTMGSRLIFKKKETLDLFIEMLLHQSQEWNKPPEHDLEEASSLDGRPSN